MPAQTEGGFHRLRKTKEEVDNIALKNSILRGELLDRKAVFSGLEGLFAAISQIINSSSLPKKDKDDLLENISSFPILIENVAEKQARLSGPVRHKATSCRSTRAGRLRAISRASCAARGAKLLALISS